MINKVIEIVENKNIKKFSKYNNLYLFTTENLNYLNLFKENKSAITVCGSGDQALNLILLGYKKIIAFDINKFSKYILYLKICAVKNLTYNEYIDFFINKKFDYEIFKKINLESNIFNFWNDVYKYYNFNGEVFYDSSFFIKNDKDFYFRNNLYLNKTNYYLLKENILNIDIEFVNCDILELTKYNGFDIIVLSNISDYLNNIYKDNALCNFNNFINKLKISNKTIIMSYLYDFSAKETYRSEIDDISNINKYFNNIKIYKFNSAYDTNKQDAIIIKE